ncbi:MAG: TetR/AcrR family transcriptional regulator [Gammaproteobacteria bacterium]|jgi:AcrR family transcriptional regulator|nr:MAG: TetR/AcrR family transcriptional regulator [Gammaproteobacteria bacterium]
MPVASKNSRPVGRPPDLELQDRRRSEILDSATLVFAEHGFAEADVQDIADQTGVGKGTVYRYFPSKGELFLAAVDHGMKNLKAAVDQAATPDKSPLARVSAGILAYLTFFDEHPEVVELIVQERAHFRDREKPTYFVHREANMGPWRDLFKGLIEEGVVRDLSVETITEFISDLLYGMMFTNHFASRKRTPSEQCQDALDLLFHGILATARGGLNVEG